MRYAGTLLTAAELPPRITNPRATVLNAAGVHVPTPVDICYDRMTREGESFWTVVFAPFMSRDLTRDTVRAVVRRGLETTKGNYRLVAPLFNLPPTDYKRFLNFLQKHECHVPFQNFRLITPMDGRRTQESVADAKAGRIGVIG